MLAEENNEHFLRLRIPQKVRSDAIVDVRAILQGIDHESDDRFFYVSFDEPLKEAKKLVDIAGVWKATMPMADLIFDARQGGSFLTTTMARLEKGLVDCKKRLRLLYRRVISTLQSARDLRITHDRQPSSDAGRYPVWWKRPHAGVREAIKSSSEDLPGNKWRY